MAYFVDRNGDLFEGDESQAEELARQGLQLATPEDVARHDQGADDALAAQEAPFTSALEHVGAGITALPGRILQGAADLDLPPEAASLLFGVGGQRALEQYKTGDQNGAPLYPGLLPEDEREGATSRIRGYVENNPTAAFFTGLAPEVGAAFAAGPLAAMGGLGGVAGGLALEGALAGTAAEARDAYVEDREFSGEAAAMNAAIDFAAGGALFGIGAGARALAKSGTSGIREFGSDLLTRARGRATKGVSPDELAPSPSGGSVGAAHGADFDDAAEVAIRDIGEGKADDYAIDLAQKENAPGYEKGLTKSAAHAAANALDDVNAMAKELTTVGNKIEDWAKGAEEWTGKHLAEQQKLVDQVVTQEGAELLEWAAKQQDAPNSNLGIYGERLQNSLSRHIDEVRKAEGVQRNAALDQMKRDMDAQVKQFQRVAKSARAQPGRYDAADDWMRRVNGYSDRLREALMDESAWGVNALAQQAQNRAWVRMIEASSRIETRFFDRLKDTHAEVGPAARNVRANPEKLHALMQKDAQFKASIMEDLQEMIGGRSDLIKARQDYGFTRLEGLDAMEDALMDARNAFNFAETVVGAERRWRALGSPKPETGGGPDLGGIALDVGLDVAGGGGVMTAKRVGMNALRWALNRQGKLVPTVAPDGSAMSQVVSDGIRAIGKRSPQMTDEAFWSSQSEYLRKSLESMGYGPRRGGISVRPRPQGPPTPPAAPSAPSGPSPGVVGGASGAAALGVGLTTGEAQASPYVQHGQDVDFMPDMRRLSTVNALNEIARGTDSQLAASARRAVSASGGGGRSDTLSSAFGRDWVAGYNEMADALRTGSPVALLEAISEGWGELPALEPDTWAVIGQKFTGVARFLQSKLPPRTGVSILRPEGWPPDAKTVREFGEYVRGAMRTREVISDIEAGAEPTVREMEAFSANWPGVYARIRIGVLERIQEKPPNPETLERLNRTFGFGGLLGSKFSPERKATADMAQQAAAQEQQQQPPPRQGGAPQLDPAGLAAPTRRAV